MKAQLHDFPLPLVLEKVGLMKPSPSKPNQHRKYPTPQSFKGSRTPRVAVNLPSPLHLDDCCTQSEESQST